VFGRADEVSPHASDQSTDLDLLVDSTGIEVLGEGEWKTKTRRAVSSSMAQGTAPD
jgi:hypothetical protein